MKHIYSPFFTTVFLWAIFILPFCANAQDVKTPERDYVVTRDKPDGFNEQDLRARMKVDGLSSPVIDKLVAQRKLMYMQGKSVQWVSVKKSNPPMPFAACRSEERRVGKECRL